MPITAGNFVDLVKSGFYNGLHFHRVIDQFMLQFGCPHSKSPKDGRAGTGGPQPNSTFTSADGKALKRDRGGNIPDGTEQPCPRFATTRCGWVEW
jgi:cyclophilin family peptidyl-prolyl cis-trans isomerase